MAAGHRQPLHGSNPCFSWCISIILLPVASSLLPIYLILESSTLAISHAPLWRRLLLLLVPSRWTLLRWIHGHSSASTSATTHGLDVGPVLERLRKVADVAGYVFVAMHGQRDDGNEAEGKPRVALDDVPAVVAAVVASAHDALVALDFLAEGVFTAREHNTHICCLLLLLPLVGSVRLHTVCLLATLL